MKVVKGLLLMLCVGVSWIAHAQSDLSHYCRLDTIFNLGQEMAFTEEIRSSQWGNEVVFAFSNQRRADSVCCYIVDMEAEKLDSVKLKVRDIAADMVSDMRYGITDLAYNERFLVLCLYDRIVLYTHGKCIDAEPDKTVFLYSPAEGETTPYHYDHAQFIDDSIILLTVAYNSVTPPCEAHLLNVLSGKAEHYVLPDYKGLLLTYFRPFTYVDVYGGQLVWTDRDHYSFTVYDTAFRVVDRVNHRMRGWKGLPRRFVREVNKDYHINDAGLIIERVIPYHKKVDMISQINWIDTNAIIVDYGSRSGRSRIGLAPIYDVWRRSEDGWHIDKPHLRRPRWEPNSQQVITKHNYFPFSGTDKMYYTPHKFVVIMPQWDVGNPLGMTRAEYQKAYKDSLAERNPTLQVLVYSHNL